MVSVYPPSFFICSFFYAVVSLFYYTLWLSDWKARADVVKLLKHLKKELTILVVSHDLK